MDLNYVNAAMIKKLGSHIPAEKLEGTSMCKKALLDEDIRKGEVLDAIRDLLIKNVNDPHQKVRDETKMTLVIFSRITGEKFPDLSLPLLEGPRETPSNQEKQEIKSQELGN